MGRGKKLAELLEPAFLARNAVNPGILDRVAQNLDALEVLDPALAARVRAQEPAAITEAYEAIHQYARPFESRRGLRQLREASPALADDLATADHPQVIRAAEALARQKAFIPPDSLTIPEGARMSKAKKAASVMGDVARGADKAPDIRRLIGELVGTDAVDFTNPEVMRLLPLNLQRGVLANDPQAIAFATQHVLRSGNQRGRAAVDALGGAVPPRAPAEPAPTMDLDTAAYPVDVAGPPAGRPRQVGVSPFQGNIGASSMDMRSPTQMPRSADLMPEEGLRPVAADDVDPDFAAFMERQAPARTPDVMEPDFAGPPAQGGVDLSGPGVPVGEPYTTRFADRASLGLPDDVDAAMRSGGPDPASTGFDDPALNDFLRTMDPSFAPPRRPPPVGGGSPPRRPPPPSGPPRRPPPSPNGSAGRRAAGIGAAGLAGALGVRLAMEPGELGDDAMATSDLAAEQTPPPQVEVREEPLVDYSAMAREKNRQANVIQRRTGRVTPESAALSREADALYLRAAEERAAGRGQPIMPSEQSDAQTSAVRAEGLRQISGNPGEDYHSQARRLMGRMNSGEFRSPADYSAAQREVNRLFALGDSQRQSSGRR